MNCKDEPSEALPVSLLCPACEGKSRGDDGDAGGCEACGGKGRMDVTICPKKFAAGVGHATFAADQAEMGAWPQPGGWMDQTQQCLDAVSFVLHDEARLRQQRRESDD